MKFITQLINRFIIRPPQIKHLGRWNIENCAEKINKKIDFSNEDHCGPCGQTKNGLHHSMIKGKEVK